MRRARCSKQKKKIVDIFLYYMYIAGRPSFRGVSHVGDKNRETHDTSVLRKLRNDCLAAS